MSRLGRRVAKVEEGRTGPGRMFVSFVDGRLSEADKQAQEKSEAARLGIRPGDLHVILLRGLGAPEATGQPAAVVRD